MKTIVNSALVPIESWKISMSISYSLPAAHKNAHQFP
jgi:hypothetical protein